MLNVCGTSIPIPQLKSKLKQIIIYHNTLGFKKEREYLKLFSRRASLQTKRNMVQFVVGLMVSSWVLQGFHRSVTERPVTRHEHRMQQGMSSSVSTASCTACFASVTEHDKETEDLLPLLNRVIPGVISYKDIDIVTQANAEGRKVKVYHEEAGTGATTSVELFVKRVDASRYAENKAWPDLRRTLLYARTETRFYREIVSLLPTNLAPKCYLAECNLEGLIDDNAHVLDESLTDIPPLLLEKEASKNELLKDRGATIILESLCPQHYIQDSPLTLEQAKQSLQALAKLHASTWEQKELLANTEERLSKTVYHLPMRNPQELLGMEESWNNFLEEFQSNDTNKLFEKSSIQNLGKRMVLMAEYIADELSPRPTDKYVSICHGDYKAMNVFLPRNSKSDGDAIMIDFASSGVGYGMCDVAMHTTHALHPNNLIDGQAEALVEMYLEELEKSFAKASSASFVYPRQIAMRHYRLAVIDYFRFILGRFWKGATLSAFDKRKNNKNTVLVNRNVDAAFALIEKVDHYLHEFEVEHGKG